MNFFILLVVLLAVGVRVVKPDDRARYLAIATAQLGQLRAAAATPRPDYDAFVAALRERTPRLVVVPAIVALNAIVFAAMLFGSGSLADPATYVAWGANLGTRTTNGEWWRLLSAMFLHGGLFLLILDAVVLLQVGAIVERLVGRAAFAAVYVAAGTMAGLHHLSAHPVDLGISTAGAAFSVYGLAAACMVWQRLRPAAVTIPVTAMKRIGIVGVVFLFLNAIAGFATASELTGFAIGAGCGAVVGWRAGDRLPGMRVVGATAAACLLAAVAYAIPLRSIADVKPAIERVRATEARTAAAFKAGADQVAHQRMAPDDLADVAEYAILPELDADDARLAALTHVPAEHQQLVADVREFLRLRRASWKARADALRRSHKTLRAAGDVNGDAARRVQAEGRFRSTQAAAGRAEAAERAASDAFARLFVAADR